MGKTISIEAPPGSTGGTPAAPGTVITDGITGDGTRVVAEPGATEAALAAKAAADKAAADAKAAGEQKTAEGDKSTPQRPDNVPEKFWKDNKIDTEAMLKSYGELETKQSKGEPKAEPKAEPTTTPKGEAALDALFVKATAEYGERGGSLSPEMYNEFSKLGVSATVVNGHIAGREATNTQRTTEMHTLAGGEEKLTAALSWAADGLNKEGGITEAEANEFNAAVGGDSPVRAANAVRSLMSRFTESGMEPNYVGRNAPVMGSDAPTSGAKGFANMAEQVKAQGDPRYTRDRAYAADVIARIAASTAY